VDNQTTKLMTNHNKPDKPAKPSQWLLSQPRHNTGDYTVLDHLRHLLSVARPADYREAILELYHTYVQCQHEAFPLDFGDVAHRVNVLCEFFKTLSECDLRLSNKDGAAKGKHKAL
jgi:hypothetical protein